MGYSDYEMKNFTQVAYADLGKAYDYLHSCCPDRDSFTIAELEQTARAIDSNADLKSLRYLDNEQKMNWRISAVHDTNAKNGFYGCIIETEPGHAAVAFRGSESSDLYDWVGSDLGLLNSTCTIEQREADRFLSKYADQINGYDSVAMTGHSLGGNLAEYATLVSRHHGIRNVDQCISFDGPGFSNEFIMFHTLDILAMSGVMTHYRWSIVGDLLFDLPGVNYRDVKVSNDANRWDSDEMNDFTRHDTKYLDFENGMLQEEKHKNKWAIGGSLLSKWIDMRIPTPMFHMFLMVNELYSEYKDDAVNIFNSVSSGFNSVYQNLVKAIKRLFHHETDHFRVNTGLLSQDADKLNTDIHNVRDSVSEMFDAVENLGTMWKGKANQAFSAKFVSEKEAIFDYLDEILVYTSSIKADSDNYSRSENYCLQVADAVKV